MRSPAAQSVCSPYMGLWPALYEGMGAPWPIGDRPGGPVVTIDSKRHGLGRLAACPEATAPSPRWTRAGRAIGRDEASGPAPTGGDLAFARNAASDVLTKGDKGFSQPWKTRNRRAGLGDAAGPGLSLGGAHLPGLSGKSYVNGRSESWLQGAACQSEKADGKFTR